MAEIVFVLYGVGALALIYFLRRKRNIPSQSPPDIKFNTYLPDNTNPKMICPHCHEKGCVVTTSVKRKKGISGAKATGVLFTAGFSLLATGLSRKEQMTHAHCRNCGSIWEF